MDMSEFYRLMNICGQQQSKINGALNEAVEANAAGYVPITHEKLLECHRRKR
jgi:hypothetical protein